MPGTGIRQLFKELDDYFDNGEYSKISDAVQDFEDAVDMLPEGLSVSDSSRIHEELQKLHMHRVGDDTGVKQTQFLQVLGPLTKYIFEDKAFAYWFEFCVSAAVNSAGYRNTIVSASQNVISQFLVNDGTATSRSSVDGKRLPDSGTSNVVSVASSSAGAHFSVSSGAAGDSIARDISTTSHHRRQRDRTNAMLRHNSARAINGLLAIFLEEPNPWFQCSSVTEHERFRLVKSNVEMLLQRYGLAKPKQFMEVVNDKFVIAKNRISLLTLFTAFVSEPSPHLHVISDSPLFDTLLKSMQMDLSESALTIEASVLAMIIPSVCSKLVPRLPELFAIYGRLSSWSFPANTKSLASTDDAELPNDMLDSIEKPAASNGNSLSNDTGISSPQPDTWDVLGHDEYIRGSDQLPEHAPLFTFLYALFPANFIDFLQNSDGYLKRYNHVRNFTDYWDHELIIQRSKPLAELVSLNPSLLLLSAEQELEDTARFTNMGSALDIASNCMDLVITIPIKSNVRRVSLFDAPGGDSLRKALTAAKLADSGVPSKGPSSRMQPGGGSVRVPGVVFRKPQYSDSNVASPSISELMDDHDKLFDPTVPAVPEDLSLDDGNNYRPAAFGGDGNVAPEMTGVHPGSSPRLAPVSGGKMDEKSPGFLPTQPQSPDTVVQHTQVSVSAASQTAANVHSAGQTPTSSLHVSSGENGTHLNTASHEDIVYHERELLIQKNERQFMSFLFYQSLFRVRRIKERLLEWQRFNDQLEFMESKNKRLHVELNECKKEITRLAENSVKEFEKQEVAMTNAMEEKNKLANDAEAMKREVVRLQTEIKKHEADKERVMKLIVRQETRISFLEMEVERLENTSGQLVQKVADNVLAEDSTKIKNVSNENEEYLLTQKIEELEIKVEELRLERDSARVDKRQIEHSLTQQLEAMKHQFQQMRTKPNKEVIEFVKRCKREIDDAAGQLHVAFEARVDEYNELQRRFREYAQEYHPNMVACSPPSREGSIDGVRMMTGGSELDMRHAGTAKVQKRTMLNARPQALVSQTQQTPYNEFRVRGRGGMQNQNAINTNTKPTVRRNFRSGIM